MEKIAMVDRQYKKRIKTIKENEQKNKMVKARNKFLQSQSVTPNDYDEQRHKLKAIQKHFANLCQLPALKQRALVHVNILSGISPKELFVQDKSIEENAAKFLRDLAKCYTQKPHKLVYYLNVGIICVAKTTRGWQRCSIIKIHEKNTCDMLLLDIGLIERISWLDLRVLDDKWCDVKPLAIRCALVSIGTAHSIDRFTLQQQQELMQTLEEQKEFYIYVHKSDTLALDIFLYYKSSDYFHCVNEIFPSESSLSIASSTDESDEFSKSQSIPKKSLISTPLKDEPVQSKVGKNASNEMVPIQRIDESPLKVRKERKNQNEMRENDNNNCSKAAKDEESDDGKDENSNDNKENSESDSPTPLADKLLSKPINVVIRYIDGIDCICICFDNYLHAFNLLRFDVQTWVQSLPPSQEQSWKVGDVCLVYDAFDGISEYLRCKIVSFNGPDVCRVYLRDVGKIIEVPTKNLKPSNAEFRNVRDFIWKIKLTGVKLHKGVDIEAVNGKLYQAVNSFDAMAISMLNSGSYDVCTGILWGIRRGRQALLPERFEYVNINCELEKWGMAKTYKSFDALNEFVNDTMKIKPKFEGNVMSETEVAKFQITENFTDVKSWLPSQPNERNEFVAFPMHVGQQLVFYVLEAHRKTMADEIKRILEQQYRAKNLEKVDPIEWKKNDACFARFDDDRKFYRATITNINFAKNDCRIRFVDYGNCQSCCLDDLRKATMFGDIPILSRQYKLENVRPISGQQFWPEEVKEFCAYSVCNRQCNLIVSGSGSKSTNEPESCILETYRKFNHLASELVANNYAEWIEPPQEHTT